jgi:hypothetical protein
MTQALDGFIARVKSLGTVAADVAREAAPEVEKAARATAAAGTDPYGKPWPAKKDGGRPMVNAAAHVTAEAAGPTIAIKLTGPDVFHHFAQREPRRQVIPDGEGGMPAPVAKAISKAAASVFARKTGAT